MQDPYAVLGIGRDAEAVVVEAAYRALMKKYHPDRASGPAAQARAREINAAYDLLKDPARRRAYDADAAGARSQVADPKAAATRGAPWAQRAQGLAGPGLVLGALVLLGWIATRQGDTPPIEPAPPALVATPPPAPPGTIAPAESAPAAPSPPLSLTGLRITTTGLGPIRVGMTRQELEQAVGDLNTAHQNEGCAALSPAIAPFVQVLVEDGRVTRVSAYREPSVRTPRGIGAGSSADAVRAAYGSALIEEPHVYAEAPAQYLTFLVPPEDDGAPGEGVRFETDTKGIVTAVHAGRGSLGYIEGCL